MLVGGDGAAWLVFLLLGVLIIIKDEKGEEVKRIEVPDKYSVEIVPGKTGSAIAAAEPAREPKPLVSPLDAQQVHAAQRAWARYLKTAVEQSTPSGVTLVLIPPGEFLMGSTPPENALVRKIAEHEKIKPDSDYVWSRLKEEGPQHRVTLTKPFWIGMTEVTIGQFKMFVEAAHYVTQAEQFGFGGSGATKPSDLTTPEMKKMSWRVPGYAVTEDSPVTQVTWNDAVQFCNWLSQQEKLKPCYRQAEAGWTLLASGTGYRLPTEAEWEYACRAGTTTLFSFGDDPARLDTYAWFNKNSDGRARAVGLKDANAFGLFDMHGNAWEWCHDFYAGDYYSKSPHVDPFGPSSGSSHVGRSGNWYGSPINCRSACRSFGSPMYRGYSHGFRLVRVQ